MTPSVLRRSGPDTIRNGAPFTPRALLHFCEICGEPASYGEGVDLLRNKPGRWFCGVDGNRNPICKRNQGGDL